MEDKKVIKSRFLHTCDIDSEEFKMEPFTIVIFGGAGDLSKRKLLPTLVHLFCEEELNCGCTVVGFGIPEFSDEQYRKLAREALQEFGDKPVEDSKWNEFQKNIFYISSDFDNEEKYSALCRKIEETSKKDSTGKINVIYYMAVPPEFTPVIVEQLANKNLCKGKFTAKVIVEKPFGRDYETAVELNRILHTAFEETQIYRIDHYLGKETIQNIIFFRFSNSIFEPLWNYKYIDNVQITVAEEVGVEHRGRFYEKAGVVRDIVQNHIMQLIGHIAMEPPVGFKADLIRDEKVKVFKSIRLMDEEYIRGNTVMGQYGPGNVNGKDVPGYRSEKNVADDSSTPTFIAAKLFIDNWRWAGVPFYIRTGKRMPKRVTEICIQFKQPPLRLFGKTCDMLEPNNLTLTIQPREEIGIHFGVKYPHTENIIHPVDMRFNYQTAFKTKEYYAYERLLVDCMKGDQTLFVRQDGVEAMWEIVDPIISIWESDPDREFPIYRAGTWGPEDSNKLLERDGRSWITE